VARSGLELSRNWQGLIAFETPVVGALERLINFKRAVVISLS
jgi:hypothetical protein